MTAGNSGSNGGPPEGDDPFGYLYRSEDGEGGQGRGAYGAVAQQPGVPRTSYNHVRAVGERSYGGQQAQSAYPRQGVREPGHAVAGPPPGGRAAARSHGADGGGHGRGTRRNGPLIAALAVVVAVIVAVGAVILLGDGDSGDTVSGSDASPAANDDAPFEEDRGADQDGDRDRQRQVELPSADAATFRLGGSPVVAADVPGAEAENGTYVAMNKPGASATWMSRVKQAGEYRLYVRYGVPGKDMNLNLYIGDEKQARPLNMKNFAGAAEGDWERGWTQTWAKVVLAKGSNAIKIACDPGNACDVNLDRAWLAAS